MPQGARPHRTRRREAQLQIVGDLIIGIVAGVVALVGDRYLRARKLRRMFSPLEGQYDHYDLVGNKKDDWVTRVKYIGGTVLETHGQSSQREWKGRIVMSEVTPGHGSGTYQHLHRPDCGLHQIQVDTVHHNQIFVLWTNTSHSKGKRNEGAYVWKRTEQ